MTATPHAEEYVTRLGIKGLGRLEKFLRESTKSKITFHDIREKALVAFSMLMYILTRVSF